MDQAERVFRANSRLENISEDLLNHRDAAGKIYDTIDYLITISYQKGQNQCPDLNEILLGLRATKFTREQSRLLGDTATVRRLLIGMAAHSEPFLHIIPELMFENADLSIVHRYVTPSRVKDNIIDRMYKMAVDRSVLAVKGMMENGSTRTNWADVQKAARTGQSLSGLDWRRERLDVLLKHMFLTDNAPDEELKQQLATVNRGIQRWVQLPLINQLQRDQRIAVISCSDLRNGSTRQLARTPDLIYFNILDNIHLRFENLCEMIQTPLFAAHADKDLLHLARDARHAESEFHARCSEIAGDLVRQLQKGLELAAPLREAAIETARLFETFQNIQKQARQKEEYDRLNQILEKIRKHGTIYEIKNQKSQLRIPEKITRMILEDRIPGALGTFVPLIEYDSSIDLDRLDGIYAIYKHPKTIEVAINRAVELYNKTGDDSLIRILCHMLRIDQKPDEELKRFIPPVSLLQLRESLKKCYMRHMPPWKRLWLMLTGSEPSTAALEKIKSELQQQEAFRAERIVDRQFKQKQQSARQEVRDLARENIRRKSNDAAAPDEKEIKNEILRYLNSSWKKLQFPTARSIRSNVNGSEFTVNKILEGAEKGLEAFADVLAIKVPGEDSIFAGRAFVRSNRDQLKETCRRKVQATRTILADPDIGRTEKSATARNQKIYNAILAALHGPV